MKASKLILESGEVFPGFSPEWQKDAYFGEVVFSHRHDRLCRIADRSFVRGTNPHVYLSSHRQLRRSEKLRWESEKIQASGVVAGWVSPFPSHWDSECSFLDWLKEQKIPLIIGVDTRELTKLLRKKGVALGAICTEGATPQKFPDPNREPLGEKSRAFPVKQIYGNGTKKDHRRRLRHEGKYHPLSAEISDSNRPRSLRLRLFE